MPGTCGRLELREALSSGFFGSVAARGNASVIGSPERSAFDDDLHAVGKTCAADGPGRRRIGKEAGIDFIHVRCFEHAVQQNVHFHDLVERRACRLQQRFEVEENVTGLACGGAAHRRPRLQIDCGQPGHKKKIPSPHRHRRQLAGAPLSIRRRPRRGNDLTCSTHRVSFTPAQAAAVTSSWILKPASILAVQTVRAGGPFATYWRYTRLSTSYSMLS